jgi:phosphoribosylamine--glycine ligase
MESKQAEESYTGYIDLNCIVNNNGIYPLEFTSRFGYPTISIQQEGMLTPISELFWELANGFEPKWRTRTGFQIGVRIVVPPFPFDDDALSNPSLRTAQLFSSLLRKVSTSKMSSSSTVMAYR